jgi:hypothetical protein
LTRTWIGSPPKGRSNVASLADGTVPMTTF